MDHFEDSLRRMLVVRIDAIKCLILLLSTTQHSAGFPIRLWPTNSRGTEGFVEAYYDGSWGFVGNPELIFTIPTATFLCKTLGLSKFGYGSGWTSMENYTGHSWLYGLECAEGVTEIEQCLGLFQFEYNEYTNQSSWQYDYGSRLYCVDSMLVNGLTQNTGIVQSTFYGKIYTMCHDGFDMNAADVVCNHLKYDGAVDFERVAPDSTPLYNRQLACSGSEYSLTECKQSDNTIEDCQYAVQVTCRAVRFTHWNEFEDEGAVEVFFDGSWGFVGDPGFAFDDVTASYLCETFGFDNGGFGTSAHSLENYYRKAWLGALSCKGTETHIMQCDNSGFSVTPSLMNTYLRGTWLYCFDYNVTNIRLVNGSNSFEGKVELEINDRWGAICTFAMNYAMIETVGDIACKQLGYEGMLKLVSDNQRWRSDYVWMSYLDCPGNETSLTECSYTKGPIPPCFYNPIYLVVECIDIDECLSNPCLHEGSCENGDQNYTCICQEKWGGTNCEMDIFDECENDPCLNDGKCIDLAEGFECECQPGFDGDTCLININECEQLPCKNGGSCEDRTPGYKCYCTNGYEGEDCEIETDECQSQPCENNGDCLDGLNEYSCACAKGFEGDRCQIEVATNNSLTIIIAVSAGCVLLLILTVIGCCFFRIRRNQRKLKSKASPNDSQVGARNSTLPYENSTTVAADGYNNIYNTVREKDETEHEEVYAEIKDDGDMDDYLNPVSAAEIRKDSYGYLTFGNDEDKTVRYQGLQERNTHDYTHLSNATKTK